VPGKAAILFDADILGYFQNVPGGSAQAGNIAYSPPPGNERRGSGGRKRMDLAGRNQ
jgi:hypothetical protein